MLVHVVTQKGKGYAPAESSADKYSMRVVKFDVVSGKQAKAISNAPSYTKVFGTELIKHAKRRSDRRGHHRRHAVGHGAGPVRSGLPRADL